MDPGAAAEARKHQSIHDTETHQNAAAIDQPKLTCSKLVVQPSGFEGVSRRFYHSAVPTLGNNAESGVGGYLVVGGVDEAGCVQSHGALLHPHLGWQPVHQVAQLSLFASSVHTTVTSEGKRLLVGWGGKAGLLKLSNRLECIDIDNWIEIAVAQAPNLPRHRCAQASIMAQDLLIIIGGWDNQASPPVFFADTHCINVVTGAMVWSGVMRTPLAYHSATVVTEDDYCKQVLIFGGCDGASENGQLLRLSVLKSPSAVAPEVETVVVRCNRPAARQGHAAAAWHNKLYIHGGQCGGVVYNDCWEFDPSSNLWCQIMLVGSPRRFGHTMDIVEHEGLSYLLLICGCDETYTATYDVYFAQIEGL